MQPVIDGKAKGFTLVELIIVIALSGILAGIVMQFITTPIDAYVDQSRRGRLVDIAEQAAGQITRDVQRALPNSIRVGCSGACVEFLRVASGGRYRAQAPGDALSFLPTDADSSFDVLGPLHNTTALATSGSADACVQGQAACVAIYNTGTAGTDAWNTDHTGGGWRPDNLATLTAVSAASVSFDNSYFAGGPTAFPASSPSQRFFLVDTAVTYLCDATAETLRRYTGYTLTHPHISADEHAELTGLANPAEPALIADQVAGCAFEYTAGTPTRNGLLKITLNVREEGEQIRLFQQIHVSNLP